MMLSLVENHSEWVGEFTSTNIKMQDIFVVFLRPGILENGRNSEKKSIYGETMEKQKKVEN
jgi:hypothetical protein